MEILVTGDRLPEFWDRSAVFFANLLSLFYGNEDETERLATEVGEVDSYGGRLIPVLDILYRGGDNLLVLERAPDEELCNYFERVLELSLPKREILSHKEYQGIGEGVMAEGSGEVKRVLAAVAAQECEWVDGYVTDETLTRIAERVGKKTVTTMKGSRRGNNKLLLYEHLREEGLPHVAMELAGSVDDVPRCLERLGKEGFKAGVLKAQVGASGIGMLKIADLREVNLELIEEHLFFEGPCMVQGWLEPGLQGVRSILSPSVQMFLDEERVYLYDVTEQILSQDSVHEGNVAPPPYLRAEGGLREELYRQAAVAGEWLHGQGYRGTASADFLVTEMDGKDAPEVYVCEINARVTGATYPAMLARHMMPGGAWLMRNLRLGEPMEGGRLLESLEWPGHLYHRGNDSGVLPINFNFGSDGLVHKGQFLCLAETPEECHGCLRAAESDLPMEWAVDRD